MEAARSMIYAKNMSLKFWAEAVNTATFVLNRTGPTKIEGKTPYELWFNKKPSVDHLRIFGLSVMFMCLMKSEENWMPKVKKEF